MLSKPFGRPHEARRKLRQHPGLFQGAPYVERSATRQRILNLPAQGQVELREVYRPIARKEAMAHDARQRKNFRNGLDSQFVDRLLACLERTASPACRRNRPEERAQCSWRQASQSRYTQAGAASLSSFLELASRGASDPPLAFKRNETLPGKQQLIYIELKSPCRSGAG